MTSYGQPGGGWTLVLRRKPAHMVQGQPEGGYTEAYELVCSDCGDDPDLDYREVSPGLRRIRGPYLIAVGVTAYTRHVRLYHSGPEWANDSPGNLRNSVPRPRGASG